jgi:hypothetical protein
MTTPNQIRQSIQSNLDVKIWELREIIQEKQTAVCLSLDVNTWELGRHLLQVAAPYICMVKIHPDLFSDWTQPAQNELIAMASAGRYQIMCDQKMADIPKIVLRQIQADMLGLYRVADWVTIMPNNYLDVAEFLAKSVDYAGYRPQLLLVGQMNTKSSLSNTPDFKAAVSEIIIQPDYPVRAIITQLNVYRDVVLGMTPGVILNDSVNPDHARYRTIQDAIRRDHNQVVILGAGLLGPLTDAHLETTETEKEIEDFRNRVISAAMQSWVATKCI